MARMSLRPAARMLLVLPLVLAAGCGMIADKDRIVIARIDGDTITRGDLYRLLREMDDEERPIIRNRADLLRVLNDYLDERIKTPLGRALEAQFKEKKLDSFLEMMRVQARETFFAAHEDKEYRNIYAMEVPPDGQQTPQMKTYGITATGLQAMHDLIDLNTDRIYLRLLSDTAVSRLAMDAKETGTLRVADADLEREYNLRKSQLIKPEWMSISAIRFPVGLPNAGEQAAAVRARVEAGENFDQIVQEYAAANADQVLVSDIENNPSNERFAGFWQSASGAAAGDMVGPVFLPEYTESMTDAAGNVTNVPQPASYLIAKVIERHAERPYTLEEARPLLEPPLLFAEQMKKLRDEHEVEIYEDKLPDPAQFGGRVSAPASGG